MRFFCNEIVCGHVFNFELLPFFVSNTVDQMLTYWKIKSRSLVDKILMH
jgi:hypothetical protein